MSTTSQNIYNEKIIILLGVGQGTKILLELFKTNKIAIDYICDNNKDNWGKILENIPVISPSHLQQFIQSNIQQKPSSTEEIAIQIAVNNIDNNIEQQLKSIGVEHIISFNQALNLLKYVPPKPHISKEQAEFNTRNRIYTDSLRGLNNDKFPLLKPEDMPEHAKEMVKKLEYLKQSYLAGENFYIDKEKTMLLQDLCNRGYYNGFRRLGGYQSHLVEGEIGLNVVFKGDVDKSIENITRFSNYLLIKNIPFMYIQLPCKLSPKEDDLPEGVNNITNIKCTELLKGLNCNNINTFDYRDYMLDNNIDFLDSFFKTDHHWTPRSAFNASLEICKKVKELIDIDIDFSKFNINNYDKILYPNLFLGSRGKNTNVIYSGLDDFELILPKFETDYTWLCAKQGFKKRGPIFESLLYPLHLDWNYYFTNPYAVYSLVGNDHTIIKNHKSKNDLKILFFNDSFSNPMASFLAPHFSELHFLDLRGYKKDLFGIIENIKPDLTIMMYTPWTFLIHPLSTDVNPYG